MIKVCTPFSYSFGNIRTVSKFFDTTWEILRDFFEFALSSKTKLWVKFLELMQISPTRQDIICVDRHADL